MIGTAIYFMPVDRPFLVFTRFDYCSKKPCLEHLFWFPESGSLGHIGPLTLQPTRIVPGIV